MKMAIQIPDLLLREAQAAAVKDGLSLNDFFIQAVSDRLQQRKSAQPDAPKRWEAAFGGLRSLHRENRRIDRIIAAEFNS